MSGDYNAKGATQVDKPDSSEVRGVVHIRGVHRAWDWHGLMRKESHKGLKRLSDEQTHS